MADGDKSKSSGSGFKLTIPIVGYALRVLFRAFKVSALAGFCLLLMEWSLFFFNQEKGFEPALDRYSQLSEQVLANSSQFLAEDKWLRSANDSVTYVTANISDLKHSVKASSASSSASEIKDSEYYNPVYFPWQEIFSDIFIGAYEYAPNLVYIWLLVTLSWLAKMLTVISMIIPGLMFLFAGVVDGLAQRKIDTYRGRRDSIDKFEKWVYATKASCYIVLFFYIAIPSSFTAYLFMIPFSCLMAVFVRNVVSTYKKYN
ncbi:DUF4400 domain-containing protein [Vibrio breoganii]|uniref:DUF4400 domain-containing protein n=1 Tax=Vibrio breoganii TaxID=553239 RepID=UPI000C82C0B0|nr:DUF4400 domain-containing protein [Vibrio breoganii]PML19297.1 hypothetical protein BCT84_18660 [Vibrio breoganii]